MRATMLCLITLAAAATAGAAASQEQSGYPEGPKPGPESWWSTGPSGLSKPGQPLTVFAVVGDHLVSGVLRPKEPLMQLVDARQPTFSCAPSQRGPDILLGCSDGSSAQLKLDGSGCARTLSGDPASLCIGLAPRYAVRRLTAPAGKTLRIDGERLVLDPAVAGD